MHTLFKSLLIVGLFLGPLTSWAQNEDEEIRTESSQPTEDIYVDGLLRKKLVTDNRLLPLQPLREGDIGWELRIQRMIDTREKLNLKFRSQELNLFNALRQLIGNGDITVFADDSFTAPLTKEEVEAKMSKVDTITDFDYDTYTEVLKIVKNDINWEKINSYRVKEIWFFDKQRSVMDCRILGIAPIYASDDDISKGIPPYPLFWVYYPEARFPMSKMRVFNDFNDMAPSTWADIFDRREFTSYIYKKSNVLDYRLKDYFVPDPDDDSNQAGIDMLLQSDKIKNELLNFEHDLWEY